MLLLRPQNEKEASVISIWHRLVNTLIENVLNAPQGSEAEIEGYSEWFCLRFLKELRYLL